ncbi:hypothetical protein BCR33DRAFT_721408, partial [Rhizoclosmatium globosum]
MSLVYLDSGENWMRLTPAAFIELYDKNNILITDLDDISDEYFKKIRNGGGSLLIRTSKLA